MVEAAFNALSPLFSGKSNDRTRIPRQLPSGSTAIALAKDQKSAKRIADQADKDRLLFLLTQPEVMGLLVVLGGMVLSQNIPFSDDKTTNEALQASATSASILVGLGHAGVGDVTTAIIAGLAGVTSLLSGTLSPADFKVDMGTEWYKLLFPFGSVWAWFTK